MIDENIYIKSLKFFGSEELQRRWMYKENKAMSDRRPADLIVSDERLPFLIDLITQLGHGVIS